jgi:hypothetical protein
MLTFTSHAKDQAATRSLPVEAMAFILEEELKDVDLNGRDVAVFICKTQGRGTYFGSNGDCIWAIVRGGVVATVMLRRSDQPATKAALRVDAVLGTKRLGR